MRSFIALSALVAVAAAQSDISVEPVSTTDNLEPSATKTGSRPVDTQNACAQISRLVDSTRLKNPTVDAELAYSCLKSIPIKNNVTSSTINSIKQMVQFQSTLKYLKDPPKGYANEGVDIIGGLDDIGKKVNNSEYSNEFDFENDIAALFTKAHDGHLNFDGMAYNGVFRWRRSRQIALISGSDDGKEPKIWAIQDFNKTGSSYTPSAVSQIDGKDSVQFLQDEALQSSYHDPDTRWNAMFFMQPAESYGLFANPGFYPGPNTTITFENGTSTTYDNYAIVQDASAWSYVEDADSFYETFIELMGTTTKVAKRDTTQKIPRQLQHPQEEELSRRYAPAAYPEPVVEHSAKDVSLAGYFIDSQIGSVGVLTIHTFNTKSNADAREFQSVVEEYISEAKKRNVVKTVIDLRTNGGGKILLGYDTYLQFFPSQTPQLMSRYRIHQASDLIGQSLSTLSFNSTVGDLYTSPFNYHSYLNKDLKAHNSWSDITGARFKDDSFTHELRYDLSDPRSTSSDRYSIGVNITGYGSRSNIKTDPFKPEDIILLSDGICSSTCSLFTELMVQQSGVNTLAIGGRPALGPMQPVGGTKGSLVLQADYLTQISTVVISNFATSRREANEWVQFLLGPFAIAHAEANVNFQDNIRKGLESDGIPTQFLNDTASCRIWYEPGDYLNATAVWVKAAEVAFGKDGGLDEKKCIRGSVTSKEQQRGRGEGNPASGQGSSNTSPTSSKGAAAGSVQPYAGLTTLMVCGAVVLGSMAFGASLI